MRPALCRLSYRAATSPPDHRELAHKRMLAPRDVALAPSLGDDRQNLSHNFYLKARRENRTRHLSITNRVLRRQSFAGKIWLQGQESNLRIARLTGECLSWLPWNTLSMSRHRDLNPTFCLTKAACRLQHLADRWAAWESNPLPPD